ncbi:TrkH family potassium uptake protein [Candidatus Micrarchaeota archaeon]|nr:TrkH family potassium uptake protein [Candidatus Micrarchaeota archaeon]
MGLLNKFTALLFYGAIPLLIPAAYGYYLGEEIWRTMAQVILVMMLPSLPSILINFARNTYTLFTSILNLIFRREAPWNYATLIDLSKLKEQVSQLRLGEALALTSLAWIIIPLISAWPYLHAGYAPTDAFFESMSGWTSTGLSVIDAPETLPQSLILYRSITQWIGGLGIIVLMLAVFKGKEGRHLLRAEGKDSLDVGIEKTAKSYWGIYIFLTLVGIAVLLFFGMDIFNAINLSFSGISNGGFFPFSDYAFTDAQKVTLACLMFLGALSFVFHKKILSFKFRALFSEEFLFFLVIIGVSVSLIYWIGMDDPYNSFLNAVSAVASGGFAIGDLSIMHEFSKYVLILLMISGGMYGSTSGGIKIWRLLVAVKAVLLRIRSFFLPSGAVQVVKVEGSPVHTDLLMESIIYVFAYVFLLLFGAGVFIATGKGMVDSLFIVASSLGNVGLSTLQVSSMGEITKYCIIFFMYIGRIEIFPTLALVRFILKR